MSGFQTRGLEDGQKLRGQTSTLGTHTPQGDPEEGEGDGGPTNRSKACLQSPGSSDLPPVASCVSLLKL